jgi:hypothetical protein
MMPETSAQSSATTATSPSWLSQLALNAVSWFLKTPEQGATTQVWLASSGAPGLAAADMGGRYFVDCQPQELQWAATDRYAASRLWKESEERAGIVYDFECGADVLVPITEQTESAVAVDAN